MKVPLSIHITVRLMDLRADPCHGGLEAEVVCSAASAASPYIRSGSVTQQPECLMHEASTPVKYDPPETRVA